MKAQKVESNQSNFATIAKATVIGGAAGYLGKLWYPLTSDEMDEEFKGAMDIIKKESKKARNKAIEDIRKIPEKTLAQDTFIKMIDVNKDATLSNAKRAVKMRSVVKKAHLTDIDKIQFDNIISAVQDRANHLCKQCSKAFVKVTKAKRSTPWFMAAGAVVGFVAGLGHNILKSDEA